MNAESFLQINYIFRVNVRYPIVIIDKNCDIQLYVLQVLDRHIILLAITFYAHSTLRQIRAVMCISLTMQNHPRKPRI